MIIKGTGYNVDFFNNIRPVKSVPANSKQEGVFAQALRGKTDTIEISAQPEDSSFLSKVKGELLKSVDRSAGADRLERLKGSVAAGNYSVNADEMARILTE